jgi:hypothetical protein
MSGVEQWTSRGGDSDRREIPKKRSPGNLPAILPAWLVATRYRKLLF